MARRRQQAAAIGFAPAVPAAAFLGLLGDADLHPVRILVELVGFAVLYSLPLIALWAVESLTNVLIAGCTVAVSTGVLFASIGLAGVNDAWPNFLATPVVAGAAVGIVWLVDRLKAGVLHRDTVVAVGALWTTAISTSFVLRLWAGARWIHDWQWFALANAPAFLASCLTVPLLKAVRRRRIHPVAPTL